MRAPTQPTISIIIPSQGRPTLERTLDSVREQLLPGDEVIVVVDSHGMSAPEFCAIEARIAPYGPQFVVTDCDAGYHNHGHAQLNNGMDCAHGDYLSFNDDDDCYTSSALTAMREAAVAHPGRPLLFRFRSYLGGLVFWRFAGLVAEATIGGHCLVVPNDPPRLGKWGDHYEGDFSMIVETLALWEPVEPVWVDKIIAVARPGECP